MTNYNNNGNGNNNNHGNSFYYGRRPNPDARRSTPIENKFKTNVRSLCYMNDIEPSELKFKLHLENDIFKVVTLDDVYRLSRFFNVSIDSMITRDFYLERINSLPTVNDFSPVEEEDECEEVIEETPKSEPSSKESKVPEGKPIETFTNDSFKDFINLGLYEITGNEFDFVTLDELYEMYEESSTSGKLPRMYFTRCLTLLIGRGLNPKPSDHKMMVDGELKTVIFGIKEASLTKNNIVDFKIS